MHTMQISIDSSPMTTITPPPPAPAITAIGSIIASSGVEVVYNQTPVLLVDIFVGKRDAEL